MFLLLGTAISLFLALLLLTKRSKAGADYVLSFWYATLAIHLLLHYFNFIGLSYTKTFLLGLELPLPLIHGPLLLLYIQFLTKQLPRRRYTLLLYFAPTLACYIYQVPFFLLDSSAKLSYYKQQESHPGLYPQLLTVLFFVSGIVYVGLSLYFVYRYRRSIESEFSNTEKINLRWLRYLIGGFALLWFGILLHNQLYDLLIIYEVVDIIIYFLVTLFIIVTGFYGVQQTDVFSSVKQTQAGFDATTQRYNKSGLKAELAEAIAQKLEQSMEKEQLYRDETITLSKLAALLDVSTNHLSQVINENKGLSFYEYVNSYRIDEFIRRVDEVKEKKHTILSLAYECGFNSKSSFNTLFKRKTALTPRQYIATMDK